MPSRSSSPPLRDSTASLIRSVATVWIGVLLSAALLLAWRRLAGALDRPLTPPTLLLVGVVATGLTAAARAASPGRLARWVISPALLLLGLSLSPGSRPAGLLAFWMLVAAEELWGWLWLTRRRNRPWSGFWWDSTTRLRPAPAAHPTRREPLPPDSLLQQFTLSREADGRQRLDGWVRVCLAAGQRTEAVHVAFCPPFPRTPELSVEQVSGPAARIQTAQLMPYGARLELKLAAAAAAPTSVLVRLTVRSPAPAHLSPDALVDSAEFYAKIEGWGRREGRRVP